MPKIKEPEARAAYLAMGTDRNLRALLDMLRTESRQDAPSFTSLGRWSVTREWQRLAAEHDEKVAVQTERKIVEQRVKATAAAVTVKPDDEIVSRHWVLQQLVDNVQQAKALDDLSPANKALELIGKELGMFVDRREVGQPGEFERLTDAELADTVAKLQGSIARLSKGAPRNAAPSGEDKPTRVH